MMTEDKNRYLTFNVPKGFLWTHLVAVVIALGVFLFDVNRKADKYELIQDTMMNIDARHTYQLGEIKGIIQDLLKAQIQTVSNDSTHKALIDDLKQRIIVLEQKK